MTDPNAAEALAKKRFLAISLVRLSGVVLIVLGLGMALDKIDVPMAHLIGVFFIIFGLIDTLVVPKLLAKRWKS